METESSVYQLAEEVLTPLRHLRRDIERDVVADAHIAPPGHAAGLRHRFDHAADSYRIVSHKYAFAAFIGNKTVQLPSRNRLVVGERISDDFSSSAHYYVLDNSIHRAVGHEQNILACATDNIPKFFGSQEICAHLRMNCGLGLWQELIRHGTRRSPQESWQIPARHGG